VLILEEIYGDHMFNQSMQIGSVFGIAVAFFLGFRMNSAYDRWWEARKIFGELTNNVRSFAAKVFIYYQNVSNLKDELASENKHLANEMIDLICAYTAQLKSETHEVSHPNFGKAEQSLFERNSIELHSKVSNEILLALGSKIESSFKLSANIEKSDLHQHINRLYDIQGRAERINNTPFLKIYSAFTKATVFIYVLLIPFIIGDIDFGGEESHLEFLSIPLIAIVSTLFLTINRLANLYGDPLEENETSVPIDEICQIIIENCRENQAKL
jgi:putative membrane protein